MVAINIYINIVIGSKRRASLDTQSIFFAKIFIEYH